MSKNVGKHFELQFKKSVPSYCFLQRIPDPPQSFTKRADTKFSVKNPYDFLLFDCINRILLCIELKTTKYKSISFEVLEDVNTSTVRMIHYHQIFGLQNASKFENVIGCFIFNFRDEDNGIERTYYQNIKDFQKMIIEINKKSFNEMDLILYDAIKIDGIKKRVNYIWDIDKLLNTINKDR